MRLALRLPLLAIALIAVLLSGCMGNVVTVSGQGYTSGSKNKSLDCGSTGTVAAGNQGAGKLTVTVTDGNVDEIFRDSDFGAGQDGDSERLTGAAGEWTLKVSTGFGYAGQWAITLTC